MNPHVDPAGHHPKPIQTTHVHPTRTPVSPAVRKPIGQLTPGSHGFPLRNNPPTTNIMSVGTMPVSPFLPQSGGGFPLVATSPTQPADSLPSDDGTLPVNNAPIGPMGASNPTGGAGATTSVTNNPPPATAPLGMNNGDGGARGTTGYVPMGTSNDFGGAGAPANPGPDTMVGDLTPDDIDQIIAQIGNQDSGLLDQVQQTLMGGVDGEIDNLPDADQLTDGDRQAITEAVANGDPDTLRDVLGEDADTPAGAVLIAIATAIQTINGTDGQLTAGTFGVGELVALVSVIQSIGLPIGDLQPLMDVIGQIAIGQQLTGWLQDTDGAIGDVPFGDDTPLVMVPGLPNGLMMPLDNGAVMIGTDAIDDGLMMGTGNPFEVAGLPVALPGAEPVPAATEPVAAGQIMVANPTADVVNYMLNQEPQQIPSASEQTLDNSTTWVIEFDRGGNFGSARYTLSEGYYYFASTENGWELFKKTFKTRLDNSGNQFAFNYMIDDQPQTLNAGETQELTGPYPPVVRFDDGSGQDTMRRLDTGTFKVAFGAGSKLDIYAADSVSAPQQTQPAAAPATSIANFSAATTRTVAKPVISTTKLAAAQSKSAATKKSVTKSSRTVADRKSTTAKKAGQRLPNGFKLFDPVKALSDTRTARRLPESFTLFRGAAEKLVAKTSK